MQLPVVDLDQDKRRISRELGDSFSNNGFAAIAHGEAQKLFPLYKSMVNISEKFFSLPLETKLKYLDLTSGMEVGYTPPGIEVNRLDGKKTTIGKGNRSEYYHIGRDLDEPDLPGAQDFGHLKMDIELKDDNGNVVETRNVDDDFPYFYRTPNPLEVPDFLTAGRTLYERLDKLMYNLMERLSDYVNTNKGTDPKLHDYVDKGNSVLRSLYYPALDELPEDTVRAGAHKDRGVATILYTNTNDGLQIQPKDMDKWVDVEVEEGTLVMNSGELTSMVTGGYIPATRHRVEVLSLDARQSIPFFGHMHPSKTIRALDENSTLNGMSEINGHAYAHRRVLKGQMWLERSGLL